VRIHDNPGTGKFLQLALNTNGTIRFRYPHIKNKTNAGKLVRKLALHQIKMKRQVDEYELIQRNSKKPTGQYQTVFDLDPVDYSFFEKDLRARALEMASDSILLYSAEGHIFYANEAACRLYCYSRSEFYSINTLQLIPPLN
jgi:PAS domain-containing protein